MATLFFVPHQDDELSMGNDITNHILSGDDVHVILCTDGTASYIRRNLSQQGTCSWHTGIHNYGITESEFAGLRDEEFKASCRALGVSNSNIHIAPQRAKDGELTIAKVKEIIQYYQNKYPNSKVKTYTPWGPVDGAEPQHPDHKRLGQGALELYNEGKIWNNDLRFYVEPWLYAKWKAINPSTWIGEVTSEQSYKSEEACAAYKVWNPGSVPSVGKTGEIQKIASNDVLNVRKGSDVSYSIAFTMKNAQEVEVIGSDSNWLKIKCLEKGTNKDKIGWCNGAYIKRFPGCNPTSKFGIGYHSAGSVIDAYRETGMNYYHTPKY